MTVIAYYGDLYLVITANQYKYRPTTKCVKCILRDVIY